jgi:hypothetical protein
MPSRRERLSAMNANDLRRHFISASIQCYDRDGNPVESDKLFQAIVDRFFYNPSTDILKVIVR